ncbi:MAG: FAD-dependent oxidoreductase, partial [Planctomycetes bacterium]|nr:FAD-dependent oxidoreductase [Planctomycetota bacterium]
RGLQVVLLEAGELGSGQTVASQGILHGGLKYTLQGLLTRSAIGIREMPAVWKDCLANRRRPHLSQTRMRASSCLLWRTETVASRLGMIGAKFGLRIAPKPLAENDRPPLLAHCPGTVARLQEPVIDPQSLIADLACQHAARILKIDAENGLRFETDAPGNVVSVTLTEPESGRCLCFKPRNVVLTAGGGNQALRERIGLTTPAMQRRPLHMVLLRGDLPELNGHCIDGRKTRVTITSDVDLEGRRVWQIGGQVAEEGVHMTAAELITHTEAELKAAIPGFSAIGCEWTTYRVDRAEGSTRNNRRPETIRVLNEGNTITAWPTKLVLVPQLAETVSKAIPSITATPAINDPRLAEWPKPNVAQPPWETAAEWTPTDNATPRAA